MITFTIAGILLMAPAAIHAQDFDGPVPPEIPGELIYIPFPVEIKIDGDLSDWEGLPSSTVEDGPMLSADPEENGSFTFSVAADLENFYITMQMPDKNIIAGKHGENYYDEDSMEFYLNASGDLSARSYDLKIFQINIPAVDIGNTDPDALTITGVFSSDIPVQGFVFKTESGWAFEAAIPLMGILQPQHGTEIGFQAQINGASTQNRNIKLIWSKADTSDQSWQNPALFGRGIFFELGRSDIPEPSAVEVYPTVVPTQVPVQIPELVSVNQVGYFPIGRKLASAVLDETNPQPWELVNGEGEVLLSGETVVFGDDKNSGEHLHEIDFSAYEIPGAGYKIVTGQLESAQFEISDEIYRQVKIDALAYFYHNRSGIPIEEQFVGPNWARPAGHITDNEVTCYLGDDPDGNSWSGCDYLLDVSGGWYDAGDFGKYVVNGGISAWTLMNLYERFPDVYPDGSLNIPEGGNGIPDLLDEARWEMDFLLSMQVPEGQPETGLVHHKIHDRAWEPLPMIPPTEVDNDSSHQAAGEGRYLYPPSTAATLNLAATAAQCARIWEQLDPLFAQSCLTAAEKAWQAALEYPDKYAGNTPGEGGGNYDDNNVADEFYWAAAELFITTGNDEYQNYLLQSDELAAVDSFDWGHTAPLGTITLVQNENNLSEEQKNLLEENVIEFAAGLKKVQDRDGYSVLIDGEYPWGSNGLIMNNTLLMAVAFDISGNPDYLDAVRIGMDYILGHNPNNISYISGYGTYAMEHPHHRFWANLPGDGYPPPPPGALSGGPNGNPTDPAALNAGVASLAPSKRYIDDIGSYTTNEVTINWNAPLVWTLTYLDEKSDWVPPITNNTDPEIIPQPSKTQLWISMLAGFVLMVSPLAWLIIRRRKSSQPDLDK